MLNIWRKYSEPSEIGILKLATVKQSKIAPCIFVLEDTVSTEAFVQEHKVDVLWPALVLVVKEMPEEAHSISF